jgi:prepilin-type processing-associated H-X9-DG protein
MTNIKILIILIALLAMGALLLMQNQAQFKLRQENEALKQQLQLAEQLTAENERLSNEVSQAKTSGSKEQMDELLKLRGEVGTLRKQAALVEKLSEENRKLEAVAGAKIASQTQPADEDPAATQARNVAIAKMNDSKKVLLSFLLFSHENQGQLPGSLEQVSQYLKGDPNQPDSSLTGTNDFEILYKGLLNAITNPASTIVIRDRQPWQAPNGTWVRSYGFADGHVEVPKSVDGNYDDWEKQHIIMTPPGAQ